MKNCKDYWKGSVIKTEFPVKLFHATPDVESVCRAGLKTRKEIKSHSLGGGPDDLVSFTTSEDWAVTIAKDLQTAARIANEEVTPQNICLYLDKQDATLDMQESPCNLWRKIEQGITKEKGMAAANTKILFESPENLAEIIEMAKKGYLQKYDSNWYERLRLSEADKLKTWREKYPSRHVIRAKSIEEDPNMSYTYVESTPEEIGGILFDIYRKVYLPLRQESGGRRDPHFFATQARNFKGIEPENVGIVEVEGFLPFPLSTAKEMDAVSLHEMLHYRGGKFVLDPGIDFASGMDEIRLASDRFHKLKVRKDLLQK